MLLSANNIGLSGPNVQDMEKPQPLDYVHGLEEPINSPPSCTLQWLMTYSTRCSRPYRRKNISLSDCDLFKYKVHICI